MNTIKLKDVDVLAIIGVERDSNKDMTHHVLTLHITAKDINPKDFTGFNGKKNIKIKVNHD